MQELAGLGAALLESVMDLSLEASTGSVNPGVELPLNWSYRNYRELQGHGAIFAPSSQESIARGCSAGQEGGDAPKSPPESPCLAHSVGCRAKQRCCSNFRAPAAN